jgi:three-Cys-motif partner protein
MRALDVIASKDRFRELVRFVFAEPDSALFAQLEAAVAEWTLGHPDHVPPILRPSTFIQLVQDLQQQFGPTLDTMPPAFLFVDPCGVTGVSMQAIATIARRQHCEVFVFFNVSGLLRVLGAGLTKQSAEMFGDEQSTQHAIDLWTGSPDGRSSCEAIVQLYRNCLLRHCNLTHVCPFRIEYEGRVGTSHYLIHASKHGTPFRIMKDIMWDLGSGEGLEYRHSRGTLDQQSVLFVEENAIDNEIVATLQRGKKSVGYFCLDLPMNPANLVAGKYYKDRLRAMEADGRIRVSLNGAPRPATTRRRIKGVVTLADRYDVELNA